MRLTVKAPRLLAVILLLISIGLLFVDVFIVSIGLLLVAVLVYDGFGLWRGSREKQGVIFEPMAFRDSLLRGDFKTFETTVTTKHPVTIDLSHNPWLDTDTVAFAAGPTPVVLKASPSHIGKYAMDSILVTATSRFGFFSRSSKQILSVDLLVYPRFLASAIALAEILVRGGAGSAGENESELKGPGLEYAETRTYVPGDSLRRIDWKATARFNSLMVKQYYRDSGAGINIMYFPASPGPMTHDEMTTQFLNMILSATSAEVPVNVFVVGSGPPIHLTGKPRNILASALMLVLETERVTIDELYSVLDIVPISSERKALILSGKERLAELVATTTKSVSVGGQGALGIGAHLASTEAFPALFILSSLVSRSPLLPGVIEDTRARNFATTIIFPPEPWVDASGIEEAYRMSVAREKLLEFASSRGCELVPLSLVAPFRSGPFPMVMGAMNLATRAE